jgi:hypothetical protein
MGGIDQAHPATDDGVQRGGQRLYGPREFQHLAFELVQPFGGLSPLAGEDGQLDLVDVAAYTLGGPPYSSTTRSATAYSTEAGRCAAAPDWPPGVLVPPGRSSGHNER